MRSQRAGASIAVCRAAGRRDARGGAARTGADPGTGAANQAAALEPESEQRPFPAPQLQPEHRAFVVDTLGWQRYHLTDEPGWSPTAGTTGNADGDPTERHFCLMDAWELGFAKRKATQDVKSKKNAHTRAAAAAGAGAATAHQVTNVVSAWLASISGLEHKAPLVEEQLYIKLWKHGLPLKFAGVPLDLEAVCGERSLAYLQRLACKFDDRDVVRSSVD
eukprot:COSAG06_NODE_5945_length_3196_cov_1.789151_2_plen_220_part_00